MRLVRESEVRGSLQPEERYSVVSCYGAPVVLVDNAMEQLRFVLLVDRWTGVPCVVPLMSHWSWRILRELKRA